MQTFLPYPDMAASAACLDYRRLGKQRVEVKQILNALSGASKGWVNHPATVMWRGHSYSLAQYGLVICTEWIARGYKDTLQDYFLELMSHEYTNYTLPHWFGDPEFHRSHQSNLLRKDPEYYGQFGWDVPHDLPYVWPKPKEQNDE